MSASFHFWETRLFPVATKVPQLDSPFRGQTIVLHHNTFCCKALHTLAIRTARKQAQGLKRNVDIFA
jgi:hypothetical protein